MMLRRSDNFVHLNNELFIKQQEDLLSSIFTSEERMLKYIFRNISCD